MFNKLFKNIDAIISLFLMLFSIYVIYYSSEIEGLQGALAQTSPGLIPGLTGAFLFICSLVLFVSSIIKNQGQKEKTMTNIYKFNISPGFIRLMITITLIVLYRYLINMLGFYITSFLFLVSLLTIVKAAKWWKIIIVSLMVTLIVGFFFKELLRIPLSDGILLEFLNNQ